jgi:DNA-binding NarL/FixJ family response regulator
VLPASAARLQPEEMCGQGTGKMPADDRMKRVIADDHQLIISRVIETVADEFAVAATLNDGARVAKTVGSLRADIVLLDISMPFMNGLAAAREVRRMGLPAKTRFSENRRRRDFVDAR